MSSSKMAFLIGVLVVLSACSSDSEKEVASNNENESQVDLCATINFKELFGIKEKPTTTPIYQDDYIGCAYNTSKLGLNIRLYEFPRDTTEADFLRNQYSGLLNSQKKSKSAFVSLKENVGLGEASYIFNNKVVSDLVVLKEPFLFEATLHSNGLTNEEREDILLKVYNSCDKINGR